MEKEVYLNGQNYKVKYSEIVLLWGSLELKGFGELKSVKTQKGLEILPILKEENSWAIDFFIFEITKTYNC